MSSGASTSDPISKALAPLKAAFVRGKKAFAALSKPARVLIVSTAVAAVVLGGYFTWKSSDVTYTVLFANMDREDASAVVAKLKEMKVPYRIGEDGGTISVPDDRARELRLDLASSGLPRGGGVGFESFDKMRLGATEFEQRVQYRRALEGELSRTIDTISSIQSSRIHLVLPEKSVFVGRSEAASASVTLKLRAGRTLGAGEVSGIVHLVASAVAGLAPEQITVVTTEGAVLHKPHRDGSGSGSGSGGGDDDDAATSARSIEASLEDRTRQMLEKVVGPGHVDVRVAAEVDRSRVERVEDHYDPKTIVRSEQRTVERTGGGDPGAAGVPGAESNLPNGAGRVDGGAPQPEGVTRETSTRNFEVDHVSEKRLVAGGSIRRLTVAVVVDGAPGARSKEDLERLTALVRGAVGADDKRGDVVTVDAEPFVAKEPEAAPPPVPTLGEQLLAYRKYAPYAAAGALATLLLAILLVRRAVKRGRAARAAREAMVVAASPIESTLPVIEILDGDALREAAHTRAAEDPATAALVLRAWLGAGEDREDVRVTLAAGTPVA